MWFLFSNLSNLIQLHSRQLFVFFYSKKFSIKLLVIPSLRKSILWFIESKAFERSKNAPVTFFLFSSNLISSVDFRIASIVELCVPQPNWLIENKCSISRKLVICELDTFSKIFDKAELTEIGLYLSGSSGFLFWKVELHKLFWKLKTFLYLLEIFHL